MRGPSIYDLMTVTVPEGESGVMSVKRFEVEEHSLENLRNAFDGRGTQPGIYTKLIERRGKWADVWMSDTDAEKRDHFEAAYQIMDLGGRVLIGGLGIGMVLNVALHTDGVEHVDVVEINEDVIKLVGPHYEKIAADHGVSLVIHHADMLTITWPRGTRWDVAWFDIWPEVSSDDLEQMTKLRRSYGQRTRWNDCWGRYLALDSRRRWG